MSLEDAYASQMHPPLKLRGEASYRGSLEEYVDNLQEDKESSGDPVDHPSHYTSHPSGIECIDITRHMGFLDGNALKSIWRAGLKLDALEDYKKARFYLDRLIESLE